MPLAAELVAHWRADDLISAIANGAQLDQWTDSVRGIQAVASGQPRLVHDGLGGRGSIVFDAADGADLLQVPRIASPMSGAHDFTVAVVFATSASNLVGQQDAWFRNTAVVDASSLGLANDWGISLNEAGLAAAGLGFGFGNSPVSVYSKPPSLSDGQWHVVQFQRAGSSLSLQVDDRPAEVRHDGHAQPISGIDLSIGGQKFGDLPFTGQIAELRVYQGALTEVESQQLYAGLVSFYDNQPPQAQSDTYALIEDEALFFQLAETGVLANDRDVEGDALAAHLVRDAEHGHVVLQADGSFVYDPARDFFGTDSFIYTANDRRASAPIVVTLHVSNSYDPPKPRADVYRTLTGQILNVDASKGVLANDENLDQVALRAILQDPVGAGSLTLQPDGSFRYDPGAFAGVATFSYRVDDGVSQSALGVVTMTINTPPVASDDQYEVVEDEQLVVGVSRGLLANDRDREGNPLTWILLDGPTHGQLTLNPDGGFVYLPAANYFGDDQFRYRISDGYDSSESATVRLRTAPVNDRPLSQADGYVGLPGQPMEIPAVKGVLSNDTDAEGSLLTAALVDAPTHGSLTLNTDGSFRYSPVAGFIGVDGFSYRSLDASALGSATTSVELLIAATPVVISEFLAMNSSSEATRTRAADGQSFAGSRSTPDWIELENQTGQSLDVSGMHLTDDPNLPKKWAFPEGTWLPSSGRLLVYASGLNIVDTNLDENNRLHTNFSLDADGEYLALTTIDGTTIHEYGAQYPVQRTNVSFGSFDGQPQYFDAPSPGQANSKGIAEVVQPLEFSVAHGFFTQPLTLVFSTPTPGVTIVYTTDGKDPTLEYGNQIPPTGPGDIARATLTISQTTLLRATAFRDGWLAAPIATQSYLFPADIVQQSTLSATIKRHPEWGPQLDESLLALPTISLVTPSRISEVEVGTSVEMIFPDGTPGFQISAGIEHFGGHSLTSPKKNMRLSFKSAYGESSLQYDLFGDGAVDEFQQLLLRTGSHDTFFWTHPDGGRGNYLRNRWAFDRQREMGQPAPHGRFVQVYINGRYSGLHELMERPNADFMASYRGGLAEEYDVLNAGTPVDGTLAAWQMLQRNEVIDDYSQVQQYLDVTNYADYMLLQFFGGNDWDWNLTQNWMAARKREAGAGYVFFSWDSDVILRTTANANVINRGGPSNLWSVRGGIKQHKEFLMLMADRAQRYFFDNGMFSDERLRSDIQALADEIRLPMIAETARWGSTSYTPNVWESAVTWMLDRFAPNGPTGRAQTVIRQLRQAGIYPSIDAPNFLVNDSIKQGGDLTANDQLRVTASVGTVYFTLDGSDPRLPGGAIHPSARVADATPIVLSSTATVKARAWQDNEWSALQEADFRVNTVPASAENLRISEIHYHPADASDREVSEGFGDADEFEFIELVNISSQVVDVRQVQLVQTEIQGQLEGVDFDFQQSRIRELAPGSRLIVVENEEAFRARYGQDRPIVGVWEGGLSNAGEWLILRTPLELIHSFSYSDRWQPASDGQGPSLQIRNELDGDPLAWAQPEAWTISRRQHGSPGTTDDSKPGDANHDDRFDSRDLVLIFAAGEYDDPIRDNSTWEDGDWNDDGEFDSADLVLAFIAGGYVPASRPRDLAEAPVVDAIWAASVSPYSVGWWDLRRPRTNARAESNEVNACGFV